MNQLESSKDKIKKICDVLKNETLDPARLEAQDILKRADDKSHEIVRAAETKAKELIAAAKNKMEEERKVFEASLVAASRQSMESLRQSIEEKLFESELVAWIEKETVDPKLGADLIKALVSAIEKEGTSADFSAYISKSISKDKVNAALGSQILEKLKEKEVVVADFVGGVQVKLHNRRLTLDISEEALRELLSRYLRKDFRNLLFQL
ncbi:MAG: V-type ATP synthase subunit E [Chlamydiales bacterium]